MIRQVTTIDGELAIKIKPEDKLKFNDLVHFHKLDKKSHKIKKEVLK